MVIPKPVLLQRVSKYFFFGLLDNYILCFWNSVVKRKPLEQQGGASIFCLTTGFACCLHAKEL